MSKVYAWCMCSGQSGAGCALACGIACLWHVELHAHLCLGFINQPTVSSGFRVSDHTSSVASYCFQAARSAPR